MTTSVQAIVQARLLGSRVSAPYLEAGVELVHQVRVGRAQHAVHHVHHQVLQPVQQLLERDERALRLHVAVPAPRPRHLQSLLPQITK